MDTQLSQTQRSLGNGLLGAVLVFGIGGIVIYALEGEEDYQPDERYVEECGACHLAYAPGLLPVGSWQGIMQGLEEHFEDNAETDNETASYISNYLEENALRPGQPSKWSMLLRNIPTEAPLRITELPGFIQAHESEYELLEGIDLGVGFFSPCQDCHRQADQALFDKELISPGYGPTFQ